MSPTTRDDLDELSDEVRGPDGVHARLKGLEVAVKGAETLAAARHDAVLAQIGSITEHLSRTEKIVGGTLGGALLLSIFLTAAVALGGGRWKDLEVGPRPAQASPPAAPPEVDPHPEPVPTAMRELP